MKNINEIYQTLSRQFKTKFMILSFFKKIKFKNFQLFYLCIHIPGADGTSNGALARIGLAPSNAGPLPFSLTADTRNKYS